MIALQRCWYLTVRDCGASGFLAEANYADTMLDRSLVLEIERKTLEIKRAGLEVHRGQPEAAALTTLPALVGIPAYFGSGKRLRLALSDNPDLLHMAIQTVTAAIQAEVFFYRERGFASPAEYFDYWDNTNQNTCILHSNHDRRQPRSMENANNRRLGSSIFHRYLLTALDVTRGKLEIRCHLLDNFHEMTLSLQLGGSLIIRKASGKMLRCPDPVCLEALPRINGLEGTSLMTTDPGRYNLICGGSTGCTHISHLVQEAALALDIYQKSNSK